MSRTTGYPSDLTDAQWAVIEPFVPPNTGVGRETEVDLRRVLDAIFYLNRTGCQWRYLPKDFPPHTTVSYYFHKWKRDGTEAKIHDALAGRLRGDDDPEHYVSIDSQTVKTTGAGGPTGYDAGKKTSGRKRHIAVNSLGLILAVLVTSADVPDAVAARELIGRIDRSKYPELHTVIVDGGYNRHEFPAWLESQNLCAEIVNRPMGVKGWVRLPRRWIVERTFAWLNRSRRLCRVYDKTIASDEAYVRFHMIHLMLKRIAPWPKMPPFKYRNNILRND